MYRQLIAQCGGWNFPSFHSMDAFSNMNRILPSQPDFGAWAMVRVMADFILSACRGLMRISMTPACVEAGYKFSSPKSLSWVRIIRDSALARAATTESGEALAAELTSWPKERSQDANFAEKFSSAKNRMVGGHQGGVVSAGFHGASGKLQSGLDMVRSQSRVSFLDIGGGGASLKHVQNEIHHDPRALKARFAVADFEIHGDIVSNIHALSITAFPCEFKVGVLGNERRAQLWPAIVGMCIYPLTIGNSLHSGEKPRRDERFSALSTAPARSVTP